MLKHVNIVELDLMIVEKKTEIDCDESFLRDTRLTDKDIINYVGDIIEEHINEI
jgi:hypothetical protein